MRPAGRTVCGVLARVGGVRRNRAGDPPCASAIRGVGDSFRRRSTWARRELEHYGCRIRPQNGANCGYTFTLGQRYFVYAQRTPGGELTTGMCSGNKLAAAAAVDLAFLKEVTGPPRGVRVFGHVRRVEYHLVTFDSRDYGGVASARVQPVGDRVSREAATGSDGDYDFRGLPAGTYNVTVTPPKGLALAGPPLPRDDHHPPPPWSVTLTNPSECAEVWTRPRTDAQVSGVLLNADGRPTAKPLS